MPRKLKQRKSSRKRSSVRTPRPYPVFGLNYPTSSVRTKKGFTIKSTASGINILEKVDRTDPKWRLENEEDYIHSKRFDYSVNSLLERYQDGASNRVIASCLMMTETAFEALYEEMVCKLRRLMGVKLED